MGYRSNVILAVTNKNLEKLFLDKDVDDSVLAEAISYCDIHEKEDWTLINWNDVKWHDGYKDVDLIKSFVARLTDSENEDERNGIEYHVMGESSDDYTVEGDGNSPFSIYLNRSLDFDV